MNRLTWIQIGIAILFIIAILGLIITYSSYFGFDSISWFYFGSLYGESITRIAMIIFAILLGMSIILLVLIDQIKKIIRYKEVTQSESESEVEYQTQPINWMREMFLWHLLLGPSAPTIINEGPIYEGDTVIIEESVEEPLITDEQPEIEPEIESITDIDIDIGDMF